MIEELTEGEPRELVLENARWKAAAVAATEKPGTLVIGGDTEVVLDGAALGQPEDDEEARAMLGVYLASGEWEGRAGAYAIQGLGSALVAGVSGDVSNVIGLPIPLLLELEPGFQRT